MTGQIHKIESMGLVDGPGIRAVVFLQGCPLRCLYCHNADSQGPGGQTMEAEALVQRLLRFRGYFERSGGGVTFSGGEPLAQPAFLLECLERLKAAGIHTCLDTSGAGTGDYDRILRSTDLVLYDVKHEDPALYRTITGREMDAAKDFAEAVRRSGVPMWVRHVVVPGLTDGAAHMAALREYISTLPNVQRVELLPFHKMGAYKYSQQGRPDPLADTPAMDPQQCALLQTTWFGSQAGKRGEAV